MTNVLFIVVFCAVALAGAAYLPAGILAWVWVVLQTPQQLIGAKFPTNLIIAIAALLAVLFNRRHARSPLTRLTVMMLILFVHTTITTFNSVVFEQSLPIWDRFWKTILLVMFIVMFMGTRTRLHATVCVIVISLGMLAVKAGVFTLVTGGGARIWGPPNSQIADNNHFGAALSMTLPLAVYLILVTKDQITRLALLGATACIPIAALFTYSRGALVALIAVTGCYWLISKYKVRIAVGVIVLVMAALPFMPEAWMNRMGSISESGSRETADGSVQQRFDSWEAHWTMAQRRPLTGGGFRTIEVGRIWDSLHPSGVPRAAHNSFFQVLGEHGFPGLFLYLLMLGTALLTALRIRAQTRYFPELAWARSLATACAITIASYSVSSLALSLATYDLIYVVIGIVACLARLTSETIGTVRA